MITRTSMTLRIVCLSVCCFAVLLFASRMAQAVDVEARVKVCAGCHGTNGLPAEPDIPIIWGQQFYYLYVQLKDYKAGRRYSEFMNDIVRDLSKEEMQALAKHFSEKNWPSNGFRATNADVKGAEIATSSGECSACHLGGFEGYSRVPRLAGQQPAYLERTMFEFKNQIRRNAEAKSSLLATYDDAAISAMARYLSAM
jgi:cytochrome c553